MSVSLGFPGMIYGSGCLKLTTIGFADLTDVTLLMQNSIPADDANRAIIGNVAMQRTLSSTLEGPKAQDF